jgi:hypothetical protein
LEFIKDWLNENYFKPGIFFPYNMSEFNTEVKFKP